MYALYTPRYFPDYVGGGERLVQLIAAGLIESGRRAVVLTGGTGADYEFDGVPVRRLPLTTGSHWSDEAPDARVLERVLREFGATVLQTTTPAGLHVLGPVAKALGLSLGMTATHYGVICDTRTLVRRGGQPCAGRTSRDDCFACRLEGKRRRDHVLARAGRHLPAPAAHGVARLARAAAGRPLGQQLRWWHEAQRVEAQRQAALACLDLFVSPTDSALALIAPHLDPATRAATIMHPLPARFAALPRGTPGDVLRVGFIGRALPIKGLDVLVEAVEALASTTPIELRVHSPSNEGEHGAYWRPLRDRVERLRGSAWQEHGVLDVDALGAIHRELDVLCVPSVWPEWLGLVTLEAQGLGTPVILSDFPTQRELVSGDGRSSWLVPARDPAALARTLADVWAAKREGRLEAPRASYPTPLEYARALAPLYGDG